MSWQPNFRANYWLSLVVSVIGIAAAIYGIATGRIGWVIGGCGIAILALAITRLRGRGKVPIPGMKDPLEGDFAPIGDPVPEETVTLVEERPASEQTPESAPPPE